MDFGLLNKTSNVRETMLYWKYVKTISKSTDYFCDCFCVQGRTPDPRAAHASATIGKRGYICGGRVMVGVTSFSVPLIYEQVDNKKSPVAARTSEKHKSKSVVSNLCFTFFIFRKPERVTFTAWTLNHGRGQKCAYLFVINSELQVCPNYFFFNFVMDFKK